MKFVKVTFEGSLKEYAYKTEMEGLQSGDKVVVENKQGLRVVTVTGYTDNPNLPPGVEAKWAFAKVDASSYQGMKHDHN